MFDKMDSKEIRESSHHHPQGQGHFNNYET